MKKFKVGDVVTLASGGPKMTITGDSRFEDKVVCEWFVKDEPKTGDFLEEALVAYKAPRVGAF